MRGGAASAAVAMQEGRALHGDGGGPHAAKASGAAAGACRRAAACTGKHVARTARCPALLAAVIQSIKQSDAPCWAPASINE